MQFLDDEALTAKGVRPTSRAQRWRLIKEGKFPKPVKLGSRNVWLESEIDAWFEARIRERDTADKVAA